MGIALTYPDKCFLFLLIVLKLFKCIAKSFETKKLNAKISEIKKQLKRGAEFEEDSYEMILMQIDSANEKAKKVKKELKESKEKLTRLTENKIVNLTDDEIYNLLIEKWINPICNGINDLSTRLIKELEKNIRTLCKKYETTYLELDTQIKETEDLLADMIDDLEADEFDKKGLLELQKLLRGE